MGLWWHRMEEYLCIRGGEWGHLRPFCGYQLKANQNKPSKRRSNEGKAWLEGFAFMFWIFRDRYDGSVSAEHRAIVSCGSIGP